MLQNFPELLQLFLYIVKKDSERAPNVVAKILVYQILTFIYKNKLELTYWYTLMITYNFMQFSKQYKF
jgi:hypothetical protein